MPELADLVVYLASPAASYITGAVMRIDGGWYDS
jgi:NAD(P)-dependent dehydrogenase (short-subunit alcohol dehydrogenase family)